MKGISMAIETIVYLILAVTVLSVLLLFFLTQAGPAQDQYTLEANRGRYCATYTSQDPICAGKSSNPVSTVSSDIVNKIQSTCNELSRRFGYTYCCSSPGLKCIQSCCLSCPTRPQTCA